MPISSPVSRRYAQALVDANAQQGQLALDRIAEEMERFAGAIQTSSDLKNVLRNPVFTDKEREAVLTAVSRKLILSPGVKRFIDLVVEKDRAGELEAIAEAVRKLVDERARRVRAEVQAAAELSDLAKKELKLALEKRTGRKVEMTVTVDPTLLGGVRAQVGSVSFDGTLKSELERIRETLSRE